MKLTAEFNPSVLSVTINTAESNISVGVPVVKEYVDTPIYSGPYEVDPSEETQILDVRNKRGTRNITINPIPSDYVGSDVPVRTELGVDGLTVTADSGYYPDGAVASVSVVLQSKDVEPSESVQTVSCDSGFAGLSSVVVDAIPSNYVGSAVTTRNSVSVAGSTVTALSGYYPNDRSGTVNAAGWKTNQKATVNPKITVSSAGLITASLNVPEMIAPINSDGWATSSDIVPITIVGSQTGQVPSASVESSASVSVVPVITVDTANGLISASVVKSETFNPISSAGWVDPSANYTANISGVASTPFTFISATQDPVSKGLYIR